MSLAILGMGAFYLWLVSIGTWTQLSQTSTYYYRLLADALRAGSPALLVEPDPLLAQLPNPYLTEARQGVPYLMDASYYNGRYYLYFGPVPAVLMAAGMAVIGSGFSDGYVVLAGGWLLLVSGSLLLWKLWRRHYGDLPPWLLGLGLAANELSLPVLWALNTARIYEAAGLCGAAFLVSGVYFAWDTLEGLPPNRLNLALASLCWGLAVGTRVVLAAGVLVLGAALALRVWQHDRTDRRLRLFFTRLFCLTAPVMVILAGLGWYNNLRFGSPLEIGMRYALVGVAGVDNTQPGQLFRFELVSGNLVNYLFNPYSLRAGFPFLTAETASGSLYQRLTGRDSGYYRERLTGLLVWLPASLLAGAWFWLRRASPVSSPDASQPDRLFYSLGCLSLAALAQFALLWMFYTITNRYYLDFVPLLNLPVLAGAWSVYTAAQIASPAARRLVRAGTAVLVGYGIVAGVLLALTADLNRFGF